ncbi:MAG: hypothetical protein MR793_02085 [Bacteroidales bacterium]|nr:hypothetical protein [Bacteroidales bacterium]
MIWTFSVEGSLLDTEPSMIWGNNVEGPRLDTEPSAIWSIIVEGSVLENGTVRDIETQRGRFNSWIPNHP